MPPVFNEKILENRKNLLNPEKHENEIIYEKENEYKNGRKKEHENEHKYINDIVKNGKNGINICTRSFSTTTKREFRPGGEFSKEGNKKNYERILLIEKYTKYDNLKKQGHSDSYILKNFFKAYISHFTHTLIVNNIIHLLRTKYKIHVSLLKAYKKNIDSIFINRGSVFFPDAIFSVGGDGTYLESAHIIANKYIVDEQTNEDTKRIELVGINSDPRRSEGKLCLDFFHINPYEEEKKKQYKENNEIENDNNDYRQESFHDFEKKYSKKKRVNILFTDVSDFVQDVVEKEKKRKRISNSNCNDFEIHAKKTNEQKIDTDDIDGIAYILKNNSLKYTNKRKTINEYTNGKGAEKDFNCTNNHKENEDNKTKCSIQIEKEKGKEKEKEKETTFYEDIQNFHCNKSEIQDEIREIKELLKKDTIEKAHNVIIGVEEYTRSILECFFETDKCKKLNRKYITVLIKRENKEVKTYKSINEVYIYEAIKNNICTYINIDNDIFKKLKSTALLITSGTGSTAWAYNVHKIDKTKMKNIINEFLKTQNDTIKQNIQNINYDLFSEYINNSICFHPDSKYMKCIIKEPVENNVYDSTDQIYKCNYLHIKTCTSNTIVYIDGIYNIKIQPNDSITLFIKEDDFIVTYK